MRIVAVDTDRRSLFEIVKTLKAVYPKSEVVPFTDPMGAVKFGFNHKTDMIFTEIPMRGIDGFALVRLILEHNEHMRVYFITATEDYAELALRMQADGYLLKPLTTEKLTGHGGG